MGLVGKPYWKWVSIDTPGVPCAGRYGHPREFSKRAARMGFGLAWSQIQECFVLYRRHVGGRITTEHFFKNHATDEAMPVLEGWLDVLRYMRELAVDRTVDRFLAKLKAEEKYELAVQRQREADEMEEPIMRQVELGLGLATPRVAMIVPSNFNARPLKQPSPN